MMKIKCHEIFDAYWKSNIKKNSNKHISKVRKLAYHRLASEMRTDAFQCHFSRMNNMSTLEKAYNIILNWN